MGTSKSSKTTNKKMNIKLNTIIARKLFSFILFTWFLSSAPLYALNTILRVAISPFLPPYQYIEKDKYVGVHIDILQKIAERYSFIIEYIEYGSEVQCLDALEQESVDMALGINMNMNKKEKSKVEFSEALSVSSICIVTHNDQLQTLRRSFANSSAVLEDGSVSSTFIQSMPGLHMHVVANQQRAFSVLQKNKDHLFIGVKNSIEFLIREARLEQYYTIISDHVMSIEYGIALKKGSKEMKSKVNAVLQDIRMSGDYEKINEKWIYENQYKIKKAIQIILIIFSIIILIVVTILIVNVRISRLLRREVHKKTKELQETNRHLEAKIIETRNSSELHNHIVEKNPNGILVFDKNWSVTLFNPSIVRLLGLSGSLLGKNIFEIPVVGEILGSKTELVFTKGTQFINEEICVLNQKKKKITYRYSIYQLFDIDATVRGAIFSIEDISRESAIKAEYFEKEKNRALNRMIAAIAHEIRNPLTSIKTFAELLPDKITNMTFQHQISELVPKEVDRVNSLISNLIDYAKPQSSSSELFILNEAAIECSQLIGYLLDKDAITINFDMCPEISVKANKAQIKQILINIILNAIDSIKERRKLLQSESVCGIIHVCVYTNEEKACVTIMDNGVGMNEDEIKKATEPFFTTKAMGTGLGLYISRQYAEKNNGSIAIESIKNHHTTVTLCLKREL